VSDKILRPTIADRDPEELQTWAEALAPVEDPEPDLPEHSDELAEFIATRLPNKELRALPEVKNAIAAFPVRDQVRADLVAAATGASLEQEREEYARAAAERENKAAAIYTALVQQEAEEVTPDEVDGQPITTEIVDRTPDGSPVYAPPSISDPPVQPDGPLMTEGPVPTEE
jgi:hypothetical protein